jgi:hypothetical protein
MLLLIFTGCSNIRNVKIPSGVLHPDSMAAVLMDVHILQANIMLGDITTNSDSALINLLKQHKLTSKDYQRNIDFYCHHLSLFDSVYDKVLNNLSRKKGELLAKKK